MRTLAQTLGLLTVSVDYRLAPAYPHPAQLDDVTTAFRYFITNANRWGVDPERIAVAGLICSLLVLIKSLRYSSCGFY